MFAKLNLLYNFSIIYEISQVKKRIRKKHAFPFAGKKKQAKTSSPSGGAA